MFMTDKQIQLNMLCGFGFSVISYDMKQCCFDIIKRKHVGVSCLIRRRAIRGGASSSSDCHLRIPTY